MLPLPGTVHGDSDRDTAVDGTDVDQPQNHTVVDASLKSPDCAEPVISSRYASVFVHKGIVARCVPRGRVHCTVNALLLLSEHCEVTPSMHIGSNLVPLAQYMIARLYMQAVEDQGRAETELRQGC